MAWTGCRAWAGGHALWHVSSLERRCAWRVVAQGSMRGSGRSPGTCGAGLHICIARATVHRWAARAGLLGEPSQAPHNFLRWCRAPSKGGWGARNDRGCVMGGVSKDNGSKDNAVEAAAPLPTPELRGRRATAGRGSPWERHSFDAALTVGPHALPSGAPSRPAWNGSARRWHARRASDPRCSSLEPLRPPTKKWGRARMAGGYIKMGGLRQLVFCFRQSLLPKSTVK